MTLIRNILTTTLGLFLSSVAAAEIQIDENLQEKMLKVGPEGTVSALVFMNDQVDIKSLSDSISREQFKRPARHELVVETLQNVATDSQGSILQALEHLEFVENVQPYWITNAIRIDARPETITLLAKRDDVNHIFLNYEIELVTPVEMGPIETTSNNRGVVENGITAVRATEVWDMGFTGEGVLVATLDTGVDGSHEALANRWAGLRPEYAGHPEWAFLDPYTYNHNFPFDSGSHGTHTMGTVCGGSPGLGIGVAPDSHWITSAGIDRSSIAETVADAIETFQWFIDPDGNPATAWDVPRVCSNSWGLTTGHGYPNCDETFWSFLDALEAAGCVVLFSAGNEGSSGLRRPGDRATDDYRTCAVAAIDPHSGSYPIASFSSRGPTYCTPSGSVAIKPDIAAPGVDTYSSVPGGYSTYSGTSMASPHINGAVALMVQANPDLEVEAIKEILYATAMDLGASGEDNDYGHGLIDCVEAVNMALETVSLSWNFPSGRPTWLEPTGGAEIPILISGSSATPNPSSAMLHILSDGSTVDLPLLHKGGDSYLATFPELDCGASVNYYFSIETTEGELSTSPHSAPDSSWNGVAWSGYESSFDEDFNTDTGWTVYAGAGTGNWIRVTPTQGGFRCDPGNDSDGSGMCFVTGNSTDEDIDDGTTILTSPTLDGSSASAVLSYDFWYNNGSTCNGADPLNDVFIIEISDDNGTTWNDLETIGPDGSEVSGGWFTRDWVLSEVPNITPNNSMKLRFTVGDLNDPSIVEAGVDSVHIGNHYCNEPVCVGDINGDNTVGVADVLLTIDQWGTSGSADINDDGVVDVADLLILVDMWGPCE
ncbi:MAG: S8 family serine peptidase [Phycisphaerales bacterium]|nr:S8 family serine peptidase [Phycisphaerales bacterium]